MRTVNGINKEQVVNRDYSEDAQGSVEHTFATILLHEVSTSSNFLLIILGTFVTYQNNPLEDSHARSSNCQHSFLGLVFDVRYVQKLGFLG